MTYVQGSILERAGRKRSGKQSGQQDKGCPVKEVIGCKGSYEVMGSNMHWLHSSKRS